MFINTSVSYRMPTVRLIFSKNNHIIEFYAVHDLHYSLGISLIPSMSLFDCIFAPFLYYKNESQVQMLLESATFPEGFNLFCIAPIKITTLCNVCLYLSKYAFVQRPTSLP
ncbi:hypothetical protein T01_2105 [Trichinella spiralis]|uniref:Uncharacterized protein n=1 Tax=Trichinella spiralis TaxID=6334 RepID=A0A0V1AZG1_TRISP|nr:hypothetical protein T01_2105 [Trichinella spiralis]